MSLFHLPVHINWMWHVRNVRRECWEIFKGRQYHSPDFTSALLVASTFTEEYLLLVNSCHKRTFSCCEFLQPHISISRRNIRCFEKEYISLENLIAHTSIFLGNICLKKFFLRILIIGYFNISRQVNNGSVLGKQWTTLQKFKLLKF